MAAAESSMSAKTGFGEHKGHQVVPHDHSGQGRDPDGGCWCSGKYLCVTCRSGELPRGVWFWGPECPQPVMAGGKR
jgi:hypothetical protein